jgi:hypothetical protein|tara:strand:+ start:231 stop:380 length:150 start_codon:yes stop_codon:yes gene_type:complete
MNYEKSIPQWLELELKNLGVTKPTPPVTKEIQRVTFVKIELDENGEPPF